MIYVKVDRKIITADSYKTMVLKLKNTSFDNARFKKDYMFNVAKRVDKLYNQFIEHYKYQGFVKALAKLGIISLIKCSDCDHFCMNIKTDDYYCSKRDWVLGGVDPDYAECIFLTNKLIRKIRVI